jgi:hypothetical protein
VIGAMRRDRFDHGTLRKFDMVFEFAIATLLQAKNHSEYNAAE